MKTKTLKDFMTEQDRAAVGNQPTLHSILKKATGRARPGKTARDKAKKGHQIRTLP